MPTPFVSRCVCVQGHSGFACAQHDFLGIHRSPWSHKGKQSYTARHGHTKADSQTVRDDARQRRRQGRNVRQGRQEGHAIGSSCNTCSADKEGHRLVTPVNRGELSGQNCSNPSNAQTGQTRDTTLQYSTLRYTTLHYITLHLL